MPRIWKWMSIAVLLAGCGKQNPVQEVTLGQSSVRVEEQEWDLAGDWPQWRGPQNNGVAEDQSLVKEWSDEKNVRWRTDVPGRGHGSPIVVGESVYLAAALEQELQQLVLAYDRSSGEEKWRRTVHSGGFPSSSVIHKKGTHANGTLACNGELLFIAFLNNDAITATALDLEGKIVWQREIGKFVSKFGYAPSPVLYKSLVIFAADNQGGGYIAALDGSSGEIAWRVARTYDSSYSSPTVAEVGGRDQLLICGGGTVTSYDPVGRPNHRPGNVLTVWIVEDDDPPRLVTAYPDEDK